MKSKRKPGAPSTRGGRRIGAGRPPGVPNKSNAEIKDLIRANVDFEKLIISLAKRAMKGNIKSAKLLLEYGWGKPPQQISISPSEGNTEYTITFGNKAKE